MAFGADQHIAVEGCASVKLGSPLSPPALAEVERHLHLHCNKWDTQIGDCGVLSRQGLLVSGSECDGLCGHAEHLATEMIQAELIALESQRYLRLSGVPKSV